MAEREYREDPNRRNSIKNLIGVDRHPLGSPEFPGAPGLLAVVPAFAFRAIVAMHLFIKTGTRLMVVVILQHGQRCVYNFPAQAEPAAA
jgi:hypothetical protein